MTDLNLETFHDKVVNEDTAINVSLKNYLRMGRAVIVKKKS